MKGQKRSPAIRSIAPILLALMLVLFFSCGEHPTGVKRDSDEGPFSGSGEIDPGVSGGFLLGSVSDSTFAPGWIEVWGMDVAYDSTNGIVSFDVQLFNQTSRDIAPPVHFVITYIVPRNIAVLEFDGVTGDGFPYFDFSSKLGGDGVLEPGERTERVTLKFHTVEPRSFAIGYRIDLRPPLEGGIIGGIVYRDDNQNGVRDRCDNYRCEPGIPRITVALEKTLSNGDHVVLLTRTDLNGGYRFWGLGEGVYKVFVSAVQDNWEVTSANPLLVTLVEGPDGRIQSFLKANFGLFPLEPPIPGNLFGPILIGPFSPFGTLLDSTFTNPPSILPVVFKYYLDVMEPPFDRAYPGVIDSASAWINGELVFDYGRIPPPDTVYSAPVTVLLPEGLVQVGENSIRLFTDGDAGSALMWRVYRKP